MKLLTSIIAAIATVFGIYPDNIVCDGYLTEEFVVRQAAERNGIEYQSDDWFILLAIRKAENGSRGKEFGVKHPRAWNTNLDTQAGWAAATIIKNRERWKKAGMPRDFLSFLADRYCPTECDAVGNINWKKNVKFWYKKLKGE